MKYNDKQNIKLENNSYYDIGYITKNSYLNGRKEELSFQIGPEEAKAVKNNLSLILVGSPTPPYIARDNNTGLSEGRVYSSNTSAALIKLECAVIINNRTGKVLHKIF